MKFSCPKCSAKYQIADEKVAGRTVKMKCRKCGTTIPIHSDSAKKKPTSKQELASAPVVRADSLRPSPAGRAGAPRAGAPRAGAPRAGAPRAAAARARSPAAPAVAPAPDIAPAPIGVEWHAGIDGQSVGPMSIREVERRMGEGSINQDTFMWCDGMEGWKQVPDIDELAPILTRSVRPIAVPPPSMPAQAKAQKPVAAVVSPTVPKPSPITPSPISSPVPSNPVITETGSQVAVKKPQAAAEAAPAGWAGAMEGLESDPPPAAGEKAPAAAIRPTPSVAGTAAAAAPNPLTAPEAPLPQIDLPSDAPGPASMRPSYESLVMQLRKKRKSPLAVIFAVGMAVIFGVALGFVFFGDQETKIVKQIVEVPAKVGEAMDDKKQATMLAEAEGKEPEKGEAEAQTGAPRPSSAQGNSSGKSSAKSTDSAPAPKEVKGLQGLSGLDGLGGPSSGPSGPSSSSGGGQPLSSSQIQSTVSKYQSSVKRGCWERALMARDKDAPSSARVSVSIKVSPSGSVTGASSSGDPKGYSGLSSCITRRVQGWQFPRSSGPTTVNVPFVFAAQ